MNTEEGVCVCVLVCPVGLRQSYVEWGMCIWALVGRKCMEAFDELVSINDPWSQEFSGDRVWT